MNEEKRNKIISIVDHTNLSAVASWEDIKKLCYEATKFKTASVCIPPCWVEKVKNKFPDLSIGTVIGFPLGYNMSTTKFREIELCCQCKVDEIDMVVNNNFVRSEEWLRVEDEITRAANIAVGNGKIIKIIVEASFLNKERLKKMTELVILSGAHFIKTSTGFCGEGATLEDVLFMRNIILEKGSKLKIKASGGIRTEKQFEDFYDCGVDRIGASSALTALGVL